MSCWLLEASKNLENCITRESKRKVVEPSMFRNGQAMKGSWWIPRHTEAKKDVVTDDTLRGAGSKH